MDLSRFATGCFFCKRLCLHEDYDFISDLNAADWVKKYGDQRKIVGKIGVHRICDACRDDLKTLLG